jgi:hypothetical protein
MRFRWCAGGLLALALTVASWGVAAPAARADGDPASDVLLFQNAFFPYSAPSNAAKGQLLGAVAAAKRSGYIVRVAVIQARHDLGADPELYAQPQLYARFLDAELRSAQYLGALVVVMPQGFGVAAGGTLSDHGKRYTPRPLGPLLRAVRGLAAPQSTDPDTLTTAGVTAVKAVAAAAGHPIRGKIASVAPVTAITGTPAPSSGGSGTTLELGGGLAVVALAAIAMIGVGIRRSRPTDPEV